MEQKRVFEYKTIGEQKFIKFNKFDDSMFTLTDKCNFIEQTKEFVSTTTFELKQEFKRDTYNFRSFQKCSGYNFPYLPGIEDFLKNNEHTVYTIDKRIGSENINEASTMVACEKCDEFIEILNYNLLTIIESVNNNTMTELRKEIEN